MIGNPMPHTSSRQVCERSAVGRAGPASEHPLTGALADDPIQGLDELAVSGFDACGNICYDGVEALEL
jgi:hypothetical protein